MEPLGVADFVRQAVELVREPARSAGLTLAANLSSESGTISGDRKRLNQALDHLLRNAITYTPAGGRVLVRSRVVDGMAEIVVSDNGPGIPPKQRERIFDRFRRSSIGQTGGEPVDGDEESAGFGLPLARQFVEAHGGSLDLLSDVGRGTSVIIRLPLQGQAEPEEAAA
jgi:signal transduction histidine kinase